MVSNYIKLQNGLIKQKEFFVEKKKYDVEYVDVRYNTYGEKNVQMSFLRLGYIIGSLGKIPNSILDIGYGNGEFISACTKIIPNCYGNDVSNYPVPKNVKFVENIYKDHYDVITFFDVLEHFEDIYEIKKLKCNYIVISVPWCHYYSDEWFMNWKHRRPDEHLWHFNDESIVNFFKELDYELVNQSNIEDTVRKPTDSNPNILTCTFKKI